MANRGFFVGRLCALAAAVVVCAVATPALARATAEVTTAVSGIDAIDISARSSLPSPSRTPIDSAAVASAPRVTFGRAQDIVGAPIDFSRVVARSTAGRALTGGGLGGPLVMPNRLPLTSARFSSGFGLRAHPLLGGNRSHSGVDLAAPQGTPVYAPASGIVRQAQWQGGYGLLVAIEHAGGMQTRYGHLSRIAVVPGQAVGTGAVIGYVGSTGLSTGPHLHYEVRIHGAAVNPLRH